MKTPDELLGGQDKPTIEQTAWVFAHLYDHLQDSGSFRYLIYNRMGYGIESYCPLYGAGGQSISNALIVEDDVKKALEIIDSQREQLRQLAKYVLTPYYDVSHGDEQGIMKLAQAILKE